MATYRRVYDSRGLQADCQEPGSAPEPYPQQSSMGYLYLSYQRCDLWLPVLQQLVGSGDEETVSQHVRGHRRLCDLAACRRRQYVDRRPVVLVLRGPGQRPWRPRLGGRQHVRGDAGSAQSVRVDGPDRRAFVGRAQQRRRRSVPTETAIVAYHVGLNALRMAVVDAAGPSGHRGRLP